MDALLGVSWASGRLIWSMKKVGHRGRRKVIVDRKFSEIGRQKSTKKEKGSFAKQFS
jgi:hypothetical protein